MIWFLTNSQKTIRVVTMKFWDEYLWYIAANFAISKYSNKSKNKEKAVPYTSLTTELKISK